MKLTGTIIPLVLALSTSVAARSIWSPLGSSDNGVSPRADAFPVDGDNPLLFCANPADYPILTIERVDLNPNPPSPGKELLIKAKGTLHKVVEEGATVHIEVKYGLITLIKQDVDLCEQVGQVDLKCPLQPGMKELTKKVDLPSSVPPGKYTVHATVKSKDNEEITCLMSTIIFRRGAAVAETVEVEMDL